MQQCKKNCSEMSAGEVLSLPVDAVKAAAKAGDKARAKVESKRGLPRRHFQPSLPSEHHTDRAWRVSPNPAPREGWSVSMHCEFAATRTIYFLRQLGSDRKAQRGYTWLRRNGDGASPHIAARIDSPSRFGSLDSRGSTALRHESLLRRNAASAHSDSSPKVSRKERRNARAAAHNARVEAAQAAAVDAARGASESEAAAPQKACRSPSASRQAEPQNFADVVMADADLKVTGFKRGAIENRTVRPPGARPAGGGQLRFKSSDGG